MSLQSWLTSLRHKFQGTKAGGPALSLTDPNGWNRLGLTTRSYVGRSVTEISAMQLSCVWSCVRLIAEVFGSLPMQIMERRPGKSPVEANHDLATVLGVTPNEHMTGVEYLEAKTVNLALRGNCYSLKVMNGAGSVSALNPIPAEQVKPLRKADGTIVYEILDRGKWIPHPASEVFHIRGFGSTGLVGLSPLQYAREAMGLSMATEEFGARWFGNGSRPGGFLEFPTWLTADQRKLAKEKFAEFHGGLDTAHELLILEGGVSFKNATIPPEDAQFLLTRQFQLVEICRFFRVPPHMIFELERATNNNIEQQALEFVKYTLAPYLKRWEQSVSRSLLKPSERGRYFLKFNLNGLLRGDVAARGEYYTKMRNAGVMSPNEIRGLEDMNPSTQAGMDDTHIQVNTVPVRLLEQIALAKP